MKHIDLDKLRDEQVRSDPFNYTVVPNFLKSDTLKAVIDSYPEQIKGGSYPLETLPVAPILDEVIEELNSPEFEELVASKFEIGIQGHPKIYTLRRYCRTKDGAIHTDSEDKMITVLLYLNEDWGEKGGRLRMLRSGDNLQDYSEEVAPDQGTLLIFKRADNSWHGHESFEGVRRSIQMNWLTTDKRRTWHKLRHSVSAHLKKVWN